MAISPDVASMSAHPRPATLLHGVTHDDWTWTTTNAAEAIAGVLTPLGWSLWGRCGERAMRRIFHAVGGLPKRELEVPTNETDLVINIFYGRIAINVDTFIKIGNIMPGTSGASVANELLGYIPDGISVAANRRRYPIVAARFPAVFATTPARARSLTMVTDQWYRQTIGTVAGLGLDQARQVFADARKRFEHAVFIQTLNTTAVIQPIFTSLRALAEKTDMDANRLMVGHGSHAETELVRDLWDCAQGRVDLETVARRYGYHGPDEGQIAGRVWRIDPSPLQRVVETYRSLGADRDPVAEHEANVAARQTAERELLTRCSPVQRPYARAVLAMAARWMPLRGGCKVAFLQSLDVCRAAAVRIGEHLVDAGILGDPRDAFFLTCEELVGGPASDAPAAIAARRAEFEEFRTLDLPVSWRGNPIPVSTGAPSRPIGEPATTLTGVGCSGGEVTARARVVLDPADVEMEVGEILVARTTDPSWASVMYCAAALLVDIGGQLSHAAVVARELGIPCVMDLGTATTALNDGDLLHVDGRTGVVQILERAR
ncbi:PEP-utilizing protein mobile region [Mycolicibacterium rhodesiae JS60]|nr:PEP-utilizing protein mobile region [Mycolicibacterium rhodesiae JS60]